MWGKRKWGGLQGLGGPRPLLLPSLRLTPGLRSIVSTCQVCTVCVHVNNEGTRSKHMGSFKSSLSLHVMCTYAAYIHELRRKKTNINIEVSMCI